MARFIGMTAETQHLEILLAILIFHAVFVVYVEVLPIRRSREISSAALAPPAAPLPDTFRNLAKIYRIIVDWCSVRVAIRPERQERSWKFLEETSYSKLGHNDQAALCRQTERKSVEREIV